MLAAPDPDDPANRFLYVLGGRDALGAPRADGEFFTVTTLEDGSQTISSPTILSASLPEARADVGAWLVTDQEATTVDSGDAWIYVGPGSGTANRVDAALVSANGDVSSWTEASSSTPNGGGAAPIVSADQLSCSAAS